MNENQTESKSLIREIKAQMRQEKIINHLKTNQKIIICFLSAILAVVIIWSGVGFYSKIQSKKYSTILHQALIDEQKGNLEKSIASLKEIYQSQAPAGVRAIASLKYAANISKNDQNAAAEIYSKISKDKKFDPYIREYSGLIAIKILIALEQKENQEKIIDLIADLKKRSKILTNYIAEQEAINQWNIGNFKEANQIFVNLASNLEASDLLRKRAAEMVELYNSRFGDDQKTTTKK